MASKKMPETELRFRNDANSLASMKQFEKLCPDLQKLVVKTDKAAADLADKHGVTLSVEIYFSLSPKP